MARRTRTGRWDWLTMPVTVRKETPAWVKSHLYRLSHTTANGFLSPKKSAQFRETTGLDDVTWRVYYHRRPTKKVQSITECVSDAQGYVVLMHGWTGSHGIWEDIPALICEANPRLVCFVPDVNGFGGSPFIVADPPPLEQCGPRGAMSATEAWLNLLQIHRPGPQRQIFTFVGHSMSGAALFHKSNSGWEETRYSLLTLAPALLHKDSVKQAIYKTLGLGIGTGLQYNLLDRFKEKMAGPVMEILASNASRAVKKEHRKVFKQAAKGTIAQTFYALGLAEETPPQRDWENLYVMLGHDDRLVALSPTLNLLADMGLKSCNLQVMLGDHYFFSISQQSRRLHGPNRDEVVRHVLRLHEVGRSR